MWRFRVLAGLRVWGLGCFLDLRHVGFFFGGLGLHHEVPAPNALTLGLGLRVSGF